MDLKSFSQKEQPKTETPNLNEADVRRAINFFGKMSNEQLMRELSKHISAKKRAGKEDEIYSILERIKPMLSTEQRKRLEEIMGSIK
jgi:CRISPR/Cas system CSM-associated protein Csm2 small subunit